MVGLNVRKWGFYDKTVKNFKPFCWWDAFRSVWMTQQNAPTDTPSVGVLPSDQRRSGFTLPTSRVINLITPLITWTQTIFVKNPEAGQFLFFLSHILAHMVFVYLLPEVRNHPYFFFSNVRVCQVIPRLKDHFARNTTHYLFPEYFQSLRD
jgi:hypothetical protein